MPAYSVYDITKDGSGFIPEILQDNVFRKTGVIYGDNGGLKWAVIDPNRFPLNVWRKSPTASWIHGYEKSAQSLGAVAFTNGPMMEPPFPALGQLWSTILYYVLWYIGVNAGTFLGAGIAAVLLGLAGGLPSGGAGAGPGALIGLLIGALGGAFLGGYFGAYALAHLLFFGGAPFGNVHSAAVPVHDTRHDYTGLYHLGRETKAFSTYAVGPMPTPVKTEIIGGLIPIVLHFAPCTPASNPAYANWVQTDGVAGWALVPFEVPDMVMPEDWLRGIDRYMTDDRVKLDGVLIAFGHDTMSSFKLWSKFKHWWYGAAPYMAALGGYLVSVGASDAVVMDGDDSVMFGDLTETMVGPPNADKDAQELYGFACY